jgi:hypothetical protein
LRPLGLGEILDRAVTLCVRNFVTFALIWVVFALPLAIFQFFGTQDQSQIFGALADILKQSNSGKPADPSAIGSALQGKPVLNGWTGAYFLSLLFLSPLASVAMVAAAGAIYLGGTLDFQAAYRVALSRYWHILGYNVMWLFSAGIFYVAFVFVTAIIVIGFIGLSAALKSAGIAIAVVFGIALTLAVIGFAMVVLIAYHVGFYVCILERRGFIESFAAGIQRVFNRIGFVRALLVGLAYLAIGVGIWLLSATGQLVLLGLVRSNVLGTAFGTLVSIAIAGFLTAFITIFYFDLRVRQEGLDLQLAAQASADDSPPTA